MFPELKDIREVTKQIAIRMAEVAYEMNVAINPIPYKQTLEQMVTNCIWEPKYSQLM